jgi:hypothetical protein
VALDEKLWLDLQVKKERMDLFQAAYNKASTGGRDGLVRVRVKGIFRTASEPTFGHLNRWFHEIQAEDIVVMDPGKGPGITSAQALEIARKDAESGPNSLDFSAYQLTAELQADGWHVAYVAKSKDQVGGGAPAYVIHQETGRIVSKYFQR